MWKYASSDHSIVNIINNFLNYIFKYIHIDTNTYLNIHIYKIIKYIYIYNFLY